MTMPHAVPLHARWVNDPTKANRTAQRTAPHRMTNVRAIGLKSVFLVMIGSMIFHNAAAVERPHSPPRLSPVECVSKLGNGISFVDTRVTLSTIEQLFRKSSRAERLYGTPTSVSPQPFFSCLTFDFLLNDVIASCVPSQEEIEMQVCDIIDEQCEPPV
jgi:hypothetical protein